MFYGVGHTGLSMGEMLMVPCYLPPGWAQQIVCEVGFPMVIMRRSEDVTRLLENNMQGSGGLGKSEFNTGVAWPRALQVQQSSLINIIDCHHW